MTIMPGPFSFKSHPIPDGKLRRSNKCYCRLLEMKRREFFWEPGENFKVFIKRYDYLHGKL
ncbi:CLUMA_CG005844, isoform A [Clunio marinus]|uniref:CLUMA_CG005844, isoform A n=1 Tax=Clunio marinus TaxID=568069 RepID=A0A1J1I1I5_9DIPT|nr:CLUMA_CG005844, isoform A [Clunio marinus]